MEQIINNILLEMEEYLSIHQAKKLQEVLTNKLINNVTEEENKTIKDLLGLFISAKKVEGCSEKTLRFYKTTIEKLLKDLNKPVRQITTEDVRDYLSNYQANRGCSKTTIDNTRRNFSSFFAWLEEEDYILKSPMKRIHKIKTRKQVKQCISDEDIEKLRDSCKNIRDLAMVDLLYSTGIRVGELVNLDIEDVDFEERECVVYGKGDKERTVYFDAKTKLHLQNYLATRKDDHPALFVSIYRPKRLLISGIEKRLKYLGKKAGVEKVHPHKFRRTMATRAIDKGMPIEQVQRVLGHNQIDTTTQYAMVSDSNVKNSHKKFIS